MNIFIKKYNSEKLVVFPCSQDTGGADLGLGPRAPRPPLRDPGWAGVEHLRGWPRAAPSGSSGVGVSCVPSSWSPGFPAMHQKSTTFILSVCFIHPTFFFLGIF